MSRLSFYFDQPFTINDEDGEDVGTLTLRLHCSGTPAVPASGYTPDTYDPGEGSDFGLDRVEVMAPLVAEGLPQAWLMAIAQAWFDRHYAAVEAAEEEFARGDYQQCGVVRGRRRACA